MTRGRRPDPPRRTTLLGGAAIGSVAVILLLGRFGAMVPITEQYSIPFAGTIARMVADVVLLLSALVLAFGVHGESDVVGGSASGRVALVLFGARASVGVLLDAGPRLGLVTDAGLAFDAIAVAATVVAAVRIGRAGVLHGLARWVLVPFAVLQAIVLCVEFVPSPGGGDVLVALDAFPIQSVLLLLVGLAYVAQGRWSVVRRRTKLALKKR